MQSLIRTASTSFLLLLATIPTAFPQCKPDRIYFGENDFDQLGSSVASAGDVNSDGYDDIIVGAKLNDAAGQDAGRAYVFSGLNGDTLYVFTGEIKTANFGNSVASAGDVNNDGYADIIIGAKWNTTVPGTFGRAYVFSGKDGDTLHIFEGSGQFGFSVASAGDVDNDGYDDLIISGIFDESNGSVYVFSGHTGETLFIFEGGSDTIGRSVASAGDVNRDGYADMIVSAWGASKVLAHVYSGQNGDTLFTFRTESSAGGISVALAGDVNGDGHSDFIVGAPFDDEGGNDAGRVYVFSGLNGEKLHDFKGEAAGDWFGYSVASAGDVNNDGYSDLLTVAWGHQETYLPDVGRAYVFSGKNGDTLYLIDGVRNSSGFGLSVASAGDINNDGLADLTVGLPYIGKYVDNYWHEATGAIYVYYGRECGDLNRDGIISEDDFTFLINYYFSFGEAPCGFIGDVNSDGSTNIGDIVYFSQFLHNNGPPLCNFSDPPPILDPKKKLEGSRTGPTEY